MDTLQAVSESFSTLEIRPTNTGASSTPSQPDVAELINDKDPFTLEDVHSIEDPICLRFKKKSLALGEEIVCVSLESFQLFVQAEAGAGKNLINLELNRVMCKDGRERNSSFLSGFGCCPCWNLPKLCETTSATICSAPLSVRLSWRD